MEIKELFIRYEDLKKRRKAGDDVYDEMIELETDMDIFLSEDHPVSEKRKISPIGIKESLRMIRTGIEYEKGIGMYAEKGKNNGKG